MICKVGHGIRTATGFKVFEAGKDYPASAVGDRGKYFENEPDTGPALIIEPSEAAAEKTSSKRLKKIAEEVTEHAG